MTDSDDSAGTLLRRLTAAMDAHDIEAFAACFHPDYQSEQPMHPARAFSGAAQARENWTHIFQRTPDFHAELLRSVVDGSTVWAEWHWTGTLVDGSPLDLAGVTLFGVRDGRLLWGRLYMEPVEQGGEEIDAAVRSTYGAE